MTIKDVAKLAGVSHGTVSNVINGHPSVSREMIQRVKEAMVQLGYVPRPPEKRTGPRRKRQQKDLRTGNIGILYVGMANSLVRAPIFTRMVHSVAKTLGERDLAMVLAETSVPALLPSTICPQRLDGLILCGKQPTGDTLTKLRKLPCVRVLGVPTACTELISDHIEPANEVIGAMAARYLVNRGHRHLAVINPEEGHLAFTVRSMAFMETLASQHVKVTALTAHVEVDTCSLLHEGGSELEMKPVIKKVLQADPRPTGLFIPSDYHVALAYRYLAEAGLVPGKDIEFIGCNNEISTLAGLSIRPATIDINADEIGRRAVEGLLERLASDDNAKPFVHVTVQPTLIEADSVVTN